jgi:hypothetical protein
MSDHSEKTDSLSRSLRQRKVLSFSAVGLTVLGAIGVFAIQGISQRNAANAAFAEAQEDYVATWCATFGAASFDITALDTWHAFIERNREFLESNQELKTTDNATGNVRLDLEYQLAWLEEWYVTGGQQYYFSEVGPMAPDIFWSTHQFFAKEKNELGNPLPIACN